jgi:uncharacterized protein YjcR
MVRTMEERMANDCSLTRRAIARDLGVDASQIRKWQQQSRLISEEMNDARNGRARTKRKESIQNNFSTIRREPNPIFLLACYRTL